MLRALSTQYETLSLEDAVRTNTPEFIAMQNANLGGVDLGGNAFRLSGDDILTIAAFSNPTPESVASGARWIKNRYRPVL